MAKTASERAAKLAELIEENRRMVARSTNGNEKAMARYDELSRRTQQREAGKTADDSERIKQDEQRRRQRAVRTGGQW